MKKPTMADLIGIAASLLIILFLGSIVIFREERHIRRNRDIVLQQDLWGMRKAIDRYMTDKEKAPSSLEELVANGYLQGIPVDPLTQSNKTWVVEKESKPTAESQSGVIDIHSGASGADANGKPYNQY